MGSESYVYLSIGEDHFVSRVDAHQQYRVGTQAEPAVFLDKVHFFDPESEKTVTG